MKKYLSACDMKKFSSEVINKLKFYVYLISDPISKEIFYVGKGKENRVFDHFKPSGDNEKANKINEITSKGLDPKNRNTDSWRRG